MSANVDPPFPPGSDDETELLLQFLRYQRSAVIRNATGIDDAQARWRPDGALIPLLGIVHHLTCVEWRWIDGGFLGASVSRSDAEFAPGSDVTIAAALAGYRDRAAATDALATATALDATAPADSWARGQSMRWVLLHLIDETARHAGHADAVRELLDGTTGE